MLLTHSVWADISSAASHAKQPAFAAVAYFGKGADKILTLRKGSSLVVDATIPCVASGATSPQDLLNLANFGVNIFSCPNLHAKVFAFDNVAFVGSANVSNNSKNNLIEAVTKIDDKIGIDAAKNFVKSVMENHLSIMELNNLLGYYVPPKILGAYKPQKKGRILVMEITGEQGPGRNSQVQPPILVWNHFFDLTDHDLSNGHAITLLDENTGEQSDRNIVRHDHNFTIEIPGAEKGNILLFKRLAKKSFAFKLHKPTDLDFGGLEHLLATGVNPLRTKGRLWLTL